MDTTPVKPKPRLNRRKDDLEIDGFYDMSGEARPSRAEEEENMALAQNVVRNVLNVVYCNMKFETWFRSPMYFEMPIDITASSATTPTNNNVNSNPLSSNPNITNYDSTNNTTTPNTINATTTTTTTTTNYNENNNNNNDNISHPAHDPYTDSTPLHKKVYHATHSDSLHIDKQCTKPVIDTMYICDTCMAYTDVPTDMATHMPRCRYKNELPGRVVYNSPYYQIRKVDGSKHQFYAQCLSLFAKLFLDSKSIFFSVQNFDFYLLTVSVANIRVLDKLATNYPKSGAPAPGSGDAGGKQTEAEYDLVTAVESESNLSEQRVIGFFSKERVSFDNFNLACINVFPPFQKRGLGRLLISYSYYLSRKAHVVGTPERPLSQHGLASYLSYWSSVVADCLLKYTSDNTSTNGGSKQPQRISIQDISDMTYIMNQDIVLALQSMSALVKEEIKEEEGSTSRRKPGATAGPTVRYTISLPRIQEWHARRQGKVAGPTLIEGYCLVRKRTKKQLKSVISKRKR